MTPDDPRHGKLSGYDAHRRANQDPCQPCRQAAARYEYDRRIGRILGRTLTTPGLGTARRIQALVALGWSFTDLAPHLGWAHDEPRKIANQEAAMIRQSTADRVAAVYDKLHMTQPPAETGAQRRRIAYAKTVARKRGWVTPLAWDDIDRDVAPTGLRRDWHDGPAHDHIDEARVHRILAGDYTLAREATTAERRQVTARWPGTLNELERATGWRADRYNDKESVA